MTMLYTVGFDKAYKETLAEIDNVNVSGEKMQVLFCRNEKGIFAVGCKFRKGEAYRSCGHWHSGRGYYDVFFRRNFRTREEGNEYFMKVKATNSI